MPKSIKELVSQYCNDPVHVSVTPAATTAERVDQYLFMVQQDEKQALLELILSERHPVPGKFERVLIFTRTKHGADRVVKQARPARHPGQRDPRQQEPAAARARARRVPQRQGADPGGDRRRRARDRHSRR